MKKLKNELMEAAAWLEHTARLKRGKIRDRILEYAKACREAAKKEE